MMTNKLILHTTLLGCVLGAGGCLDAGPATDEPAADQTASQAEAITVTQPPPNDIIILPQTCLTQTADATMTLGEQPGGYYFSHVNSDGTAYTSGVCPYFVVDVVVPGNYTVGGPIVENAFTLSGQINDLVPSSSNCPNITQTIKIYKKTRNLLSNTTSAYSLIANQAAVGSWQQGVDITPYCALTNAYRYESAGSFLFTDTYRVMLQPLYNGSARAARVNWQWSY